MKYNLPTPCLLNEAFLAYTRSLVYRSLLGQRSLLGLRSLGEVDGIVWACFTKL